MPEKRKKSYDFDGFMLIVFLQYPCSHRCKANCHSGDCPNADKCKKKVKITCKCKRLKKDIPCDLARNKTATVECDDLCLQKKEEERKLHNAAKEEKQRLEELKNKKELEKYQKLFEGKKKQRERKHHDEQEEVHFIYKYKLAFISSILLIISIVIYYVFIL